MSAEACQVYGKLKRSNQPDDVWKAVSIDDLRRRFPSNLRVAYVEEPSKSDPHYYSVLLGVDPATGRAYYWDAATRTVTWERPVWRGAAADAVAARAAGLDRAYRRAVTAAGRPGLLLYSKAVGCRAEYQKWLARHPTAFE